ncbi:MAG: phosphatase PAP2 family protein [Oscillospiraceae bacterium]|nr:phosphatase PAP2 family protein [Oscillospiraceae bacterium]
MKKPTVDYSGFRLSRLTEPRFSHLFLLLGWVFYFTMYILTEKLIPAEACHVVHSVVDDWIPFREEFLIFYCFWYLLVFVSAVYFLLYDVDSFKKLHVFLLITQVVSVAVYIIYPTRQDLRPASFERQNFLTALMANIYAADTNTGVCPSIHVAYSIAIASVWLKYREASRLWKAFIAVITVLICLSTMFVKQHSFVDVVAAAALCLVAEVIVFHVIYPAKKPARE